MADELTYVRATVLSSRPVTPHLSRLEFEWDAGSVLHRCGSSDEALLLCVPVGMDDDAPLPGVTDDDLVLRRRSRWYTVRAVDDDRRRVTLDVVRHGAGVVTTWAQHARPGARVALSSTTGWYSPPDDGTWQLLVGDLTALPAMARIAEDTSGRVVTRVLAEVHDAADESYLADTGAQVTYLHNRHLAAGSRLPERLHALGPLCARSDGRGYVYVAGETAATRAIRRYLRHELGLPPRSYGVIGYWTVDADRWRALWEAHGEELAALYALVDEPGADAEAVRDRYDARIDELVGTGG